MSDFDPSSGTVSVRLIDWGADSALVLASRIDDDGTLKEDVFEVYQCPSCQRHFDEDLVQYGRCPYPNCQIPWGLA